MRIIAGTYRGTRLAALGKGDPGAHLRPTPDRVRESLFNLLAARLSFDGLRVLDLFAGTGALGFEALSRGAADVVFVENGRVGQRLIATNTERLRCADRVTLLRRDATRLGAAPHPCDLVFLDPPYGAGLGQKALVVARENGWLGAGATIVWEENAPQPAPNGFELCDQRRNGDTHLTLLGAL